MLTDGELAQLRADLDLSLAGTAVISTSTWASDDGGGGSMTWSPSGTVDCRIAPAAGDEGVSGARLHPDTEVIVTLPRGTAVTVEDRIEHDSVVYAVTNLRAPRTWEISRRVEAREIV